MRLETAQRAICKAFSKLTANEELEIDFHGGEPFLAFDLIRDVCQWIWSQEWPVPYICFATTNGTLIQGRIKDWMEQNSDRFWLGLSLDGSREMQNLNRTGSYDQIDVQFFLSQWPSQPVKMTVSDKTLPLLTEGVQFLHKSGFQLTWNLAYGIDWSESHYAVEFARQLKLLIDFYLEHPQFEVSGPLAMGIEALGCDTLEPQKWCGVGTHMMAVDIDGEEYPCHMFLPITSASALNNVDWLCNENFKDSRCDACSILPMCATCYGQNLIERGNIASRDRSLCNMFKIQALACSYLKAKLLTKQTTAPGSLESAARVLREIEAVKRLQKTITTDLSESGIFV